MYIVRDWLTVKLDIMGSAIAPTLLYMISNTYLANSLIFRKRKTYSNSIQEKKKKH